MVLNRLVILFHACGSLRFSIFYSPLLCPDEDQAEGNYQDDEGNGRRAPLPADKACDQHDWRKDGR